jgi:hypothetical protein
MFTLLDDAFAAGPLASSARVRSGSRRSSNAYRTSADARAANSLYRSSFPMSAWSITPFTTSQRGTSRSRATVAIVAASISTAPTFRVPIRVSSDQIEVSVTTALPDAIGATSRRNGNRCGPSTSSYRRRRTILVPLSVRITAPARSRMISPSASHRSNRGRHVPGGK